METILGIALILPFVPALVLTLFLRARAISAFWAIVVGLVLAVGLFVYGEIFVSNVDEGVGSDRDWFRLAIFIGSALWLLGVGAGVVLSHLRGNRGDWPQD